MEIYCPVCNHFFQAKRITARYCSTRCRVAAHREKLQDKQCPWCGDHYTAQSTEQEYCSIICTQQYLRNLELFKKEAK